MTANIKLHCALTVGGEEAWAGKIPLAKLDAFVSLLNGDDGPVAIASVNPKSTQTLDDLKPTPAQVRKHERQEEKKARAIEAADAKRKGKHERFPQLKYESAQAIGDALWLGTSYDDIRREFRCSSQAVAFIDQGKTWYYATGFLPLWMREAGRPYGRDYYCRDKNGQPNAEAKARIRPSKRVSNLPNIRRGSK